MSASRSRYLARNLHAHRRVAAIWDSAAVRLGNVPPSQPVTLHPNRLSAQSLPTHREIGPPAAVATSGTQLWLLRIAWPHAWHWSLPAFEPCENLLTLWTVPSGQMTSAHHCVIVRPVLRSTTSSLCQTISGIVNVDRSSPSWPFRFASVLGDRVENT